MKKYLWYLISLFIIIIVITLTSCGDCEHEYIITYSKERTCQSGGVEIKTCSICGKENKKETSPISHKYISVKCCDYQICEYCNTKSDIFFYHSTDNGICSLCGELYISKQNQLLAEDIRHKNALLDLENSYNTNLAEINSTIQIYRSSCIYSRSTCTSKISSLNSQINQKKAEYNSVGNSSTSSAKKFNIQLQIQQLNTEKSQYQNILNIWNSIDTLQIKKTTLQNEYYSAVSEEHKLHESIISKINDIEN